MRVARKTALWMLCSVNLVLIVPAWARRVDVGPGQTLRIGQGQHLMASTGSQVHGHGTISLEGGTLELEADFKNNGWIEVAASDGESTLIVNDGALLSGSNMGSGQSQVRIRPGSKLNVMFKSPTSDVSALVKNQRFNNWGSFELRDSGSLILQDSLIDNSSGGQVMIAAGHVARFQDVEVRGGSLSISRGAQLELLDQNVPMTKEPAPEQTPHDPGQEPQLVDAPDLKTIEQRRPQARGPRVTNAGVIRGGGILDAETIELTSTGEIRVGPSGDTSTKHNSQPSASYVVLTGGLNTSTGKLSVSITPTYYGRLSVLGTVTISGAALEITTTTGTGFPATGDTFYIIKATGINFTPGFGPITYIPTSITYSHPGVVACTGYQCYRLVK